MLANSWDGLPLAEWGLNVPKGFGSQTDDDTVPDKDPNILIKISVHPGIWMSKREEIMTIMEKMKKTYNCTFKADE
jgi:hypothetical protein